jgi:N-acetylglucosamine-6-phosphate deacetylase
MLAIAGAHEPSLLRPFDLDDLTGVILVTLAPELPGATDVIARLHAAGVVVAAGHTEAIDLSAVDGVTHVFNAMAPLHRAPGPAGPALADDRLFVTLVADGEHVERAATSAPARYARLADRGRLRVGARADLVLLTPTLDVVTTVAAGEIIWSRSSTEPGSAASGRLHDERPRPH